MEQNCIDENKRCIEYNESIAKNYDIDRKEENHWVLENLYIKNNFIIKKLICC